MNPAVLIVEDESLLAGAMRDYLGRRGYEPIAVGSGEAALDAIKQSDVDLVVLDHHLPGMDGLEVLRQIRQLAPVAGVVMVTAHGSVKTAVDAMRSGAVDYLSKPVDLEELTLVLEKAWQHVRLQRELRYLHSAGREGDPLARIVGDSEPTRRLRKQVERLATLAPEGGASPPILVTGETGTGKGLVARIIHDLGLRAEHAFVELNCAAIPAPLLESELFGYERGAFTDARAAKTGLFEFADGGTLFLDEVGAMPLDLQAKFLKVIEEQTVRRLGGLRPKRVDVRIVAATNADLDEAVKAGTFRADLLYRLRVLELKLAPLRQRAADVLPLARYYLERIARKYRRPKRLRPDAEARLLAHGWPGNVRELANLLERVVLLHEGEEIGAEDLALPVTTAPAPLGISAETLTIDFSRGAINLADVERRLIVEALKAADGNRRRAAELLGISGETLRYRLEKYAIEG
jgi:two-component system, NtrC family, response regulator AtoC